MAQLGRAEHCPATSSGCASSTTTSTKTITTWSSTNGTTFTSFGAPISVTQYLSQPGGLRSACSPSTTAADRRHRPVRRVQRRLGRRPADAGRRLRRQRAVPGDRRVHRFRDRPEVGAREPDRGCEPDGGQRPPGGPAAPGRPVRGDGQRPAAAAAGPGGLVDRDREGRACGSDRGWRGARAGADQQLQPELLRQGGDPVQERHRSEHVRQPAGQVGGAGADLQRGGDHAAAGDRAVPELGCARDQRRLRLGPARLRRRDQDADHGDVDWTGPRSRRSARRSRRRSTSTSRAAIASACSASATATRRTRTSSSSRSRSSRRTCGTGNDTSAPTTTHVLAPATPNGDGGWYDTDVKVTLTAKDNDGGSGLDKTEYREQGAANWTAYSAPFDVTTAGSHTIEYRSTDKKGNVEATRSVTFKIDKTGPTTTAKLNGEDPKASYTGDVAVDLDATDATSGVKATEIRVDGGEWKPYVEEETILNTEADLAKWAQAGPGKLTWNAADGGFFRPCGGLGMPWYPVKDYGDFSLKFQWRDSATGSNGNGGAFVRFPNPAEAVTRTAATRYPCQVGSAPDRSGVGRDLLRSRDPGQRLPVERRAEDGLDLQLLAAQRHAGEGSAARDVGGLRDQGRRPDLHDHPQRRGPADVREHAGQARPPARVTRRRRIASSRAATSACRTTPTPTSSTTRTSACSRWTRARCAVR